MDEELRRLFHGLSMGVTVYEGGYPGSTQNWSPAGGVPVRIIERRVEVPVYIERTAPQPTDRVYPPAQGITRPYHCTKPAGKHPGYAESVA